MRLAVATAALGAAAASGAAVGAAASYSCVDVVASSSKFTGTCSDEWSSLKPLIRPMQPQAGYAWVQRKLDKDFSTEADAQASMDAEATPAVLGTDAKGVSFLAIVDDHHTLCALDASGYSTVTASVNVLCDLRDYSTDAFFKYMVENNFTYLARHPTGSPNALPEPILPAQLPTHFSFTARDRSLTDDPWRSLAGFARKVTSAPDPAPSCSKADGKYCERCMYRGCGANALQPSGSAVDFFEFKWSYFFLWTVVKDASYWPSADALDTFQAAYDALPPAVIGNVDTAAWQAAADLLVPLCRADATGDYQLPVSMFATGGNLPGYVAGYEKLGDDPTCDADSTCV